MFHEKYMYGYKTVECNTVSKGIECSKDRDCFFYHKDDEKRRCPFDESGNLLYNHIQCKIECCGIHKIDCEFSHNDVEVMYHPTIYKTRICNDFNSPKSCKKGRWCAFAHGIDDLRSIDDSNTKSIPSQLPQSTIQDQQSIRSPIKSNNSTPIKSKDRFSKSSSPSVTNKYQNSPHGSISSPQFSQQTYYQEYLSTHDIVNGVEKKTIFIGIIKVYESNPLYAYVDTTPTNTLKEIYSAMGCNKSEQPKIYIKGLFYRNRALDGDIVGVEIIKDHQEMDGDLIGQNLNGETETIIKIKHHLDQPKPVNIDSRWKNAKVVTILASDHKSKFACTFLKQRSKLLYFLTIVDKKLDVIMVKHPQAFNHIPRSLYVIELLNGWDSNYPFVLGQIKKNYQTNDELDHDIMAFKIEYNLLNEYNQPFEQELKFMNLKSVSIMNSNQNRRDHRKLLTYSINLNATNEIPNCFSCQLLSNGNIKYYTHITDVTLYIPPKSLSDTMAVGRGTQVNMDTHSCDLLHRSLTTDLLSLLSGKERSAITIEWEFTEDLNITETNIYHSIIQPNVNLTFTQVQQILDHTFLNNHNGVNGPIELKTSTELVDSVNKLFQGINKFHQIYTGTTFDTLESSISFPYINTIVEQTKMIANYIASNYQTPSSHSFIYCATISCLPNNIIEELKQLIQNYGLSLPLVEKKLKELFKQDNETTSSSSYSTPPSSPTTSNIKDNQISLHQDLIVDIKSKYPSSLIYILNLIQKLTNNNLIHYTLDKQNYQQFPFYLEITNPFKSYADIYNQRIISNALLDKLEEISIEDLLPSSFSNIDSLVEHLEQSRRNGMNYEQMYKEYCLSNKIRSKPLVTNGIIVEIQSNNVTVWLPNINRTFELDFNMISGGNCTWLHSSSSLQVHWDNKYYGIDCCDYQKRYFASESPSRDNNNNALSPIGHHSGGQIKLGSSIQSLRTSLSSIQTSSPMSNSSPSNNNLHQSVPSFPLHQDHNHKKLFTTINYKIFDTIPLQITATESKRKPKFNIQYIYGLKDGLPWCNDHFKNPQVFLHSKIGLNDQIILDSDTNYVNGWNTMNDYNASQFLHNRDSIFLTNISVSWSKKKKKYVGTFNVPIKQLPNGTKISRGDFVCLRYINEEKSNLSVHTMITKSVNDDKNQGKLLVKISIRNSKLTQRIYSMEIIFRDRHHSILSEGILGMMNATPSLKTLLLDIPKNPSNITNIPYDPRDIEYINDNLLPFTLEENQLKVIHSALFNTITIVEGPKGSGKTTLASIICYLSTDINSGYTSKILLCGPNDYSVDANCRSILKLFPSIKTLRVYHSSQEMEFGNIEKNDKLEYKIPEDIKSIALHQKIYNQKRTSGSMTRDIEGILLNDAKIICCTSLAAIEKRITKLNIRWVVVDNSNQEIEPQTLCALSTSDHFVLLGDRISTVEDCNKIFIPNSNLRNMYSLPLLKRLSKNHNVIELFTNFTSHQSFVELLPSNPLYKPFNLRNLQVPKPLLTFFDVKEINHNYKTTHMGQLQMEQMGNNSECFFIVSLLTYLVQSRNVGVNSIIVVSSSSIHKELLEKSLENRKLGVKVVNANEFQYYHFDYIIISLNSNNCNQLGGEILLRNLLLSSSKGIILIGDVSNMTSNSNIWEQFIQSIKFLSPKCIHPISTMERRCFNVESEESNPFINFNSFPIYQEEIKQNINSANSLHLRLGQSSPFY